MNEENKTLENRQYKKMTQTPIWKLILILGFPTTISMLITNIYNMADTYFVSQISLSASGATGIVFSVMAILQAFGFMLGHGAGSNISRELGAKKVEKAKIYASTSFFLSILAGTLIMVIGFCFLEPLMYLLGSTPTILQDAKTYAFFILLSGPAMTSGCVMNNILRYEGKAVFAMIGLTAGGVLNMVLDPIFIFGLGLNIAGAGLATAIAQYISALILIIPFLTNKTVTKIHPQYITWEMFDVTNILITGSPSFLRQGLNSLSASILNAQASIYGDAAIAAMSVVSRVSNLLFSFALGIGQGFQPVASFNYGSKQYRRVQTATWFTMMLGSLILVSLCSFCYVNATEIITLFRNETAIVQIGTEALHYSCITLFLLPMISVGNMLFQSVGASKKAMFLAALQSGLIFIPLLLLLSKTIGLRGIEIAQPLSYIISCVITLPFVVCFFHELNQNNEKRGL